MYLRVFAVLLLLGVGQAGAAPENFRQAKKAAAELYRDHPVSFYCGCDIRYQGKQLVPDFARCGYTVRKQVRRAERIEWEHVVPAWVMGHQLQCWQQGGRKACSRDSETFRRMEADLHNLVPAIGEVNGDRSNYRFVAEVSGAPQYGRCPIKVDFKGRRVEPPAARRGEIARIYLYMADKYGLRLSKHERQQYLAWHRMQPVQGWERERDRRIAALQGDANPWIQAGDLAVDAGAGSDRRH